MDETLTELAETIAGAQPGAVARWAIAFGELTVTVPAGALVGLVRYLRDEPRLAFVSLIDVCGVDWPAREKRFDVVYHLLSPQQNLRIRLKVETDNTAVGVLAFGPGGLSSTADSLSLFVNDSTQPVIRVGPWPVRPDAERAAGPAGSSGGSRRSAD